jgi:hypothetical protein
MRQLFLAGLTAGFMTLGLWIQSNVSANPLATQAAPTTVEGCLQSDGAAFTLRAGDTRYALVAGDGVDLSRHVNHQVELTGTIERADSGRVLKVSALKMIAGSCAA